MEVLLVHDSMWDRFRVVADSSALIDIARKQLEARAGVESRPYSVPIQLTRSFNLGDGMTGNIECIVDVHQTVDRSIGQSQAQLLTILLGGGVESVNAIAESAYSKAVAMATQAGITDTFGVSAALHLVNPEINRQLCQLAQEIERLLPFIRCSVNTQLALAPAMTGRIASMDQARELACIEVTKIAVTSPLDIREELSMRLSHYQNTLATMAEGESSNLPRKLERVIEQFNLMIRTFQPDLRMQLRIPEPQTSLMGSLFRYFAKTK